MSFVAEAVTSSRYVGTRIGRNRERLSAGIRLLQPLKVCNLLRTCSQTGFVGAEVQDGLRLTENKPSQCCLQQSPVRVNATRSWSHTLASSFLTRTGSSACGSFTSLTMNRQGSIIALFLFVYCFVIFPFFAEAQVISPLACEYVSILVHTAFAYNFESFQHGCV
jgi:hypothetical protein